MSARTRWVVLDGDSRAFLFTGLWSTSEPGDTSAHLGTLWTTTAPSGSSMRFWFNEMNLFGIAKAGGSGEQRPTVSCTVDGNPTTSDDRATGESFACAWKGDETRDRNGNPHTFLLNVSIPEGSPSSSFSIDSVWYLPAPDSGDLFDQGALVEYDHNDPHIYYTSGNWEPLADDGGNAVVATQIGSSATVSFIGTKVTWEGWTPAGFGFGISTGTYWVDGGQAVTFTLNPPTSPSDPTTHGIKLIEVEGLSAGEPHNLTVEYNGPSTPIVLDHLLIQGGDFRIDAGRPTPSSVQTAILPPTTGTSGLSGSPPGSSSPTATTQPSTSSSAGSSAGTIAGIVVGGLAFILFLALLGFLFARRKRKKAGKFSHNPIVIPPPLPTTPVTPQSAWATIATSPTHSEGTNPQQPHSPTLYRKGQQLPSSGEVHPEPVMDEEEVHRHQDSGVRLTRRTSLPPLYTRE
ncbi:hypothetical protein BKA70DRAFT_827313 [Coprinopsis sp. MPI-PUGE-AT-0042]|nr:hypothetical protein BKA70DRAFT_827313 [Coprinopsis sp. MPI-PUGE-AT-0042]